MNSCFLFIHVLAFLAEASAEATCVEKNLYKSSNKDDLGRKSQRSEDPNQQLETSIGDDISNGELCHSLEENDEDMHVYCENQHKMLQDILLSTNEHDKLKLEEKGNLEGAELDEGGTEGIFITDNSEKPQHYSDRLIKGMVGLANDSDCSSGEYDFEDAGFDVEDAIISFDKCKIVVLRNVFQKTHLHDFRSKFTKYIKGLVHGMIAHTGITTNMEPYHLHQLDYKRWEVLLAREFAEKEILMNDKVTKILSHDKILGENLNVHSLGAALSNTGATAQTWHTDNPFLFENSFKIHGVGGHDLPSYAVTMMVPMLDMSVDHGPTEFCIGSSFLSGLGYGNDDLIANSTPLKNMSLMHDIIEMRDCCSEWRPKSAGNCKYSRAPILRFGDALLFDYTVMHRGGANTSPDLRAIMYATFSRDWFKDGNFYKDDDQEEWIRFSKKARFAIPDYVDGAFQNMSGEDLEGISFPSHFHSEDSD